MKAMTEKAISAFRSVMSGVASREVIADRWAQCLPCPERVTTEAGQFCGACGCPKTRFAELNRKLQFARLDCPLKRPGFSNAEAAP